MIGLRARQTALAETRIPRGVIWLVLALASWAVVLAGAYGLVQIWRFITG